MTSERFDSSFSESLSEPVLAVIESVLRFSKPTPVQEAAIPLLMSRRDGAVQAETGSGKTLAYLVPVVECILQTLGVAELVSVEKDSKAGADQLQKSADLKSTIVSQGGSQPAVSADLRASCASVSAPASSSLGDSAVPTEATRGKCEPLALIILPTRVLAKQVAGQAQLFLRRVELLVGGSGMQAMRPASLVVGTPGRILHALRNGDFAPGSIQFLILDEADRLLSNPDFPSIMEFIPKQRRTGLFSATLDACEKETLKRFLRNPYLVRVTREPSAKGASGESVPGGADPSSTAGPRPAVSGDASARPSEQYVVPEKLRSWYTVIPYELKPYRLFEYVLSLSGLPEGSPASESGEDGDSRGSTLSGNDSAKTRYRKLIVFVLTCDLTEYLWRIGAQLKTANPSLEGAVEFFYLNSHQTPARQRREYESFAGSERFAVLFTTDIAARGIDLAGVTNVLQYDPPKQISSFLHRCGRTARCFTAGDAGAFLSPEEEGYAILLRNRGIPVLARQCGSIFPSGAAEPSIPPALALFRQQYPPPPETVIHRGAREEVERGGAVVRDLLKEKRVLEQKSATLLQKLEALPAESDAAKTGRKNLSLWQKRVSKIDLELAPFLEKEKAFAEGKKAATFNTPFCSFLRGLGRGDRDLFDAAQAAFVSWCRGYDESDCKVVLALSKLPVGEYAMALGLLKLPRNIKSLCDRYLIFQGEDVEIDSIAYKEAEKEAQRLRRLQQAREAQEARERHGRAEGSEKGGKREAGGKLEQRGGQSVSGASPDSPEQPIHADSNRRREKPSSSPAPSKPEGKSLDRSKFSREKQLLQMLDAGKITEKEFDRLLDDYLDGEEKAARGQRRKQRK